MRLFSGKSLHFTLCVRLSFALLVLMIALFFYYVWSEKQIDSANNRRYMSLALIHELRRSGDESTQLVRNYVISGDISYLRQFEKHLALHGGKLADSPGERSSGGLAQPIERSTNAGDDARTIQARMAQAGLTENERQLVIEASRIAESLARIDRQAIQLVAAADSDKANRNKALLMLFDQPYLKQKAELLALIDEVVDSVEKRSQHDVDKTTRWAWLMRTTLIGFGIVLLVLIGLCEKLFLATLGAFPETVYRAIRSLGTGNSDGMPPLTSIPKNSVMGHLIQTKRQLAELENQRKQNQQSLQLMSKVFSESQEGIFLANEYGILIDVNLAFMEITGCGRDECLGEYASILKSEEHPEGFYDEIWTQIKTEGSWRGEIWNRKKDGKLYAAILNFSAVDDDDGHLLCYLGMLTDITQLKLHQKEIEEIAFHDSLTSLPNRPLLADRMQQALAIVQRNQTLLAVACLDLDGFKAVNDAYGHSAGDSLLIEASHRLLSCVRVSDTVARLGGDEFAILLSGIESRAHCEATLQRILSALTIPYHIENNHTVSISGSIGYTIFPDDSSDPDTLLRHADQAMYAAKQAGKNRFQYFDIREDKRIQANCLVMTRIEKALINRELCLYIQPKINLKTGRVVGAEALLRWQHPIRGVLLPGEFLPLTENNELAISIGEWTMQEAYKLMATWRRQGLKLPLSINVSAYQIRQKDFCDRLAAISEQFPEIPPGQLEIEIIESAALDDLQKISQLIARCKTLGVNFALDDFGTGYSSLNYLKRLSVATLKIDQSFVQDLLNDENDLAIVRGVVGLARAFNTDIIAEGLENWEQAQCLLDMGCELAQGFVIARPMPADNISEWISHFKLPELKGVVE
ncbi:MAG: putative bifunctional diguanylate cyclase/phosphodiesterase [Gammaproteobacteria bacterium]